MKKPLLRTILVTGLALALAAGQAGASLIVGGDAPNQAAADSIMDIVFAIDTSGSMSDDIAAIGAAASTAIRNLDCPDTDCWVRARFMGIAGNSGAIFNENVRSYVLSRGGVPLSNSTEDNGPVINDLINNYEWNNDAVGSQRYFRAIVTIGDEGTQDGAPVSAPDYLAAQSANALAVAESVFIISWATDDPSPGVVNLFRAMAIGGSITSGGTTYDYADTKGSFLQLGSGSAAAVEKAIEDIVCFVSGGGTGGGGSVPEPGSLALLAIAAAGATMMRRRQAKA